MPWASIAATTASAAVIVTAGFRRGGFLAWPISFGSLARYWSGSELIRIIAFSISSGGALPKVLARMR